LARQADVSKKRKMAVVILFGSPGERWEHVNDGLEWVAKSAKF